MKLSLKNIIVEDRMRRDLGDVEELAECIRDDGLLQPLVVEKRDDGKYYLVAGGRRYAALTLLDSDKVFAGEKDFSTTQVTVLNDLTPTARKKLELIENIQRKDMTWQEKCLGIADYHKYAKRDALREGDSWSQSMTGKLLNMSQANVSYALDIAEELRSPESPYWKCDSMLAAQQLRAMSRLDEANKEMLRRMQAKKDAVAKVLPESMHVPQLVSVTPSVDHAKLLEATNTTPRITRDEIYSFYFKGSCLDLLPQIAAKHVINHIVCDPPYGIDMANLGGGDDRREWLVDRTAAEHTVNGNLELLPAFLRVAFDVIARDGFLCMWYDLDHHEKIAQWANEVGWKVCRWPLVWCKTSNCLNSAAQYNITKSTEVCYIFRRSEESIIKAKQPRNWVCAGTAATATHPFCKPHEVWKYLIETVSTEGQTIIDPFAGEGSSLASMFKLKRLPIGIEVNEQHIGNGIAFIESELNDPLASLYTNDLV